MERKGEMDGERGGERKEAQKRTEAQYVKAKGGAKIPEMTDSLRERILLCRAMRP